MTLTHDPSRSLQGQGHMTLPTTHQGHGQTWRQKGRHVDQEGPLEFISVQKINISVKNGKVVDGNSVKIH